MSESTVATMLNADIDCSEPRPQCRLIRLPEVMDRVGMKRSAIYQRMREGHFPRSRSLGTRCAVWVETEIDEWIESITDN